MKLSTFNIKATYGTILKARHSSRSETYYTGILINIQFLWYGALYLLSFLIKMFVTRIILEKPSLKWCADLIIIPKTCTLVVQPLDRTKFPTLFLSIICFN